ncbi:nuclear transport factor 2 family protein [Winogradskyella sp.]|uniref:nuclear transport factor 2 family protein n=1 Tax=Winogradskyella sp. TaxID=1883156 RepID=UPI0035120D52
MKQLKLNQSIKSLLLCSIGFLLGSGIATAQVDQNSDLFKTLKAKDSILFKIGFNKCKVDKSAELMFDDLEFYHDKSGITNSKEEFVKTMKNGICRANNPEKVYRFLVDESLEVFPMYNNGELYGALQNGKHFFSTDENMTFEKSDNYALFSHLWIIDDDEWKLKRVMSYNHVTKEIIEN